MRAALAAFEDGGAKLVRVTDDGVGLPPGFQLSQQTGTGLRNLALRLDRLYGARASLTMTPHAGGGAQALVTLPVVAAAAEAIA